MLNTFYILRSRWQEVLLIVGLQAGSGFAASQIIKIAITNNTAAFGNLFFAALLFTIFLVVAKLLTIGFSRTSFTDGPLHYEPGTLLKIGHHYFWRVLEFEILIWIIGTGVGIGLYFAAILAAGDPERLTKESANMILLFCAALGMLLTAKPMLLGPAAIMVTDCGVFGAFGWLSWLRLSHAKILLATYIFWIAAELGKRLLITSTIALVSLSLVQGLLAVILYVKAVKTVADVYIQTEHEESEGKPEDQIDTTQDQGESY
jgi:hypothetical protein